MYTDSFGIKKDGKSRICFNAWINFISILNFQQQSHSTHNEKKEYQNSYETPPRHRAGLGSQTLNNHNSSPKNFVSNRAGTWLSESTPTQNILTAIEGKILENEPDGTVNPPSRDFYGSMVDNLRGLSMWVNPKQKEKALQELETSKLLLNKMAVLKICLAAVSAVVIGFALGATIGAVIGAAAGPAGLSAGAVVGGIKGAVFGLKIFGVALKAATAHGGSSIAVKHLLLAAAKASGAALGTGLLAAISVPFFVKKRLEKFPELEAYTREIRENCLGEVRENCLGEVKRTLDFGSVIFERS